MRCLQGVNLYRPKPTVVPALENNQISFLMSATSVLLQGLTWVIVSPSLGVGSGKVIEERERLEGVRIFRFAHEPPNIVHFLDFHFCYGKSIFQGKLGLLKSAFLRVS